MKPAPFRYVRASRLDDALAELARYGDDDKVLAGGQSIWAEPRHEGAPIQVRMAPAHGQRLQHRARGSRQLWHQLLGRPVSACYERLVKTHWLLPAPEGGPIE